MKGQMTDIEGLDFHFFHHLYNTKKYFILSTGENERLQVIVKQKDTEINDIKKVMIILKIMFFYFSKIIIFFLDNGYITKRTRTFI